MQAPGTTPWGAAAPDPGAIAMQNAASLGEASTIATAQLLGGLSGLLVSEGLARLLREMMGGEAAPAAAEKPPAAGAPDPAAMSADALKNIVMQGAVGRILALNTVNTYLSLATSQQLTRIGAQLIKGAEEPATPVPPPVWAQPGAWQQPSMAPQPQYWYPYRPPGR